MDSVDPPFQVVVVFPDLREPIMRIFLRGLTMTAAVLSATASYAADQTTRSFVGDTEAEYYGEEYSSNDESASSSGDNEGSILQASATAHVGDAMPANPNVRSASMQSSASAPYHAAGLRKLHASHIAGPSHQSSCDGSCDGGCDGGCQTRSRMTKMMSGKCPEMWLSAEALLWFPQARTAPALAVVTPVDVAPLLGNGGTVIGEEFGNNLSPGFRLDAGRYFGDGTIGIGGRFWMLSEDDDAFSLASDGSDRSIGRPIFSTANNSEASIEIATNANSALGGNNGFNGEISGEASIEVIAAEAYARFNLGRGREYHTDLIGGYSYFGIDDDLAIRSVSRENLPGLGSVTSFSDSFNTSNNFHGGQLGAETILRRGRWVAKSLAKVHLGNMNQEVLISGTSSRQDTTPAAPGDPRFFGNGLLSGSNAGTYEQDVFAFAPEMNLKLGYRFRDHVTFTVGYSFIYWSNVALAGGQIDRNVNLDPVTGVQPGTLPFNIRESGFWAQGIDLGTTIEF